MKNRKYIATLLLTAAVAGSALAGCSTGTSSVDSAASETTEATTEASAEEATETADIVDTASTEADPEADEFIPADFVQERAGKDSFDSFDEIISYLQGTDEGYAYITIDGASSHVLAVAGKIYPWDEHTNYAIDVSLYAYNSDGDKIVNIGNAFTNGTAYPIRCSDGILYVCDRYEYAEMKVSKDTNGLFYTKLIDLTYDDDGNASLSGFVREDDDINSSSDDIGITTEDEYNALFTALDDVAPINFHRAAYESYDAAISELPSDYGYAYINLDGYEGDILVTTDFVYEWDNGENVSIDAFLYAENNGEAEFLGSILTGGTGNPFRCEDGTLYCGNQKSYRAAQVQQNEDGSYSLYNVEYAGISYDADGNAAIETEGDVTATTEDDVYNLISSANEKALVQFQKVD